MRVFSIVVSILLLFPQLLISQNKEKPKILVAIVVDQMRYDYLLRFEEHFQEGGFKRLMKDGLNLTNANYTYKPTKTGPAHASIFTAASPSVHGIVGNSWYSRAEGDYVNCVRMKKGDAIHYSPERMQVNTLADEMKMMDAETMVFGISLKDRGAILPAGHTADAAYWFEGDKGGFVSSEYYKSADYSWLEKFNQKDIYAYYLKDGWKLSLSEEVYSHLADDRSIEQPYVKGEKAVFPYDFKAAYEKDGEDLIKSTPQGNELLSDFAKELIVKNGLGKDEHMDFLSISFSAPDYIGHQFGVRSREVMDAILRLDQCLADLLSFFDKQFEEDYILFLTADHGAAINREHLNELGVPSGHLNMKEIRNSLDAYLDSTLGEEDWILARSNMNFYFNYALFQEEKEDAYEREDVLELAYYYLKEQEGIANVYLPGVFDAEDHLIPMTARGYHSKESGDIVVIEKANWNSFWSLGSGHESPYEYDTHVPLLFYGKGVKKGSIEEPYAIRDIIPSLASQLGIGLPDGVNEFKLIPLSGE